jgi:hypothetical protein
MEWLNSMLDRVGMPTPPITSSSISMPLGHAALTSK